MFTTIVAKEIREIVGSMKFAVTFGACALLILLSFYIGAANYNVSRAMYEASNAENVRQLEGLTDWTQVEQHRIFLPPQPLAALVTGVSNDIGRTTEVEGSGELVAYGSRFNEDPLFAVFRFLDLGFIFQIVLALFAILLGYDAISGEKECGTLKLALSNPVPRATWITGKLTGAFICLTGGLLIAISLSSLLLPVLGVPMTGSDWIGLALIVACGLLYFGVFLTMSVCVSAMTRRSANSFLILLVVWVVSVLILPRASVLMAGRAIDVPSVDELAAQKGSYASDLWKSYRDAMSGYTGTKTDDIEVAIGMFDKFMDSIGVIRTEKMDGFVARLNEERYNRQVAQEDIAFAIARLSPMTSLSLATSRLAGTSLDLKRRYYAQAKAYQEIYAAFMTEKTGRAGGGGMIMIKIGGEEEIKEPIDPMEMPVFEYQPPTTSEVLAASAFDMGLLAMFNLLFFAGAFVAFVRYDVR